MLSADSIANAARNAAGQYFRLVLVIAPENSEKPNLLKQLHDLLGATSIKIGAEISQRLLEMTERQRTLRLPRLLDDVLVPYPLEQVVILDNIEILFDLSLALNPLSMLQKLSRNRTIIAFWDGAMSRAICLANRTGTTPNDGWLTYAIPGHPEYRRYPAQDILIVQPGP